MEWAVEKSVMMYSRQNCMAENFSKSSVQLDTVFNVGEWNVIIHNWYPVKKKLLRKVITRQIVRVAFQMMVNCLSIQIEFT